ncbi:MAG: CPBP family intramembrane metalloprotease, partial [Clostridia bacterium]|nr:CPBP family intramembrane metalloprotease [Clostridia bacterium]
MWFSNYNHIDVSVFPNAQMLYPAAGVALAFLITKKDDKELPKPFFLLVLITTGILVLLSVLSICMPDQLIIVAGNAVSLWLLAAQYVILLGSLVAWVMLLAVGKKKRAAYGLRGANAKKSTCCIVGFILLYVLRTIFAYVITGEFSTFTEILARPTTWIAFASLAINFWLVFLAFFGEEYGWRYFLQPLMQR